MNALRVLGYFESFRVSQSDKLSSLVLAEDGGGEEVLLSKREEKSAGKAEGKKAQEFGSSFTRRQTDVHFHSSPGLRGTRGPRRSLEAGSD